MLTEPKIAAQAYKKEKIALVDDGLMLQLGIEVGDSIKLGKTVFPIGGRLMTAFGSIDAGSSFAPPVYINKVHLEETNLVQPGSLVNYAQYHKVERGFDIEGWRESRREVFRNESMRARTVEGQKQNLEQAFSSLNNFLNLVALISLLLACIGVASSVLIYVKGKIQSIAILRCLGMKSQESFMVYFVQILFLGIVSVLLGAVLGSVIQVILPIILAGFLPYEVNMSISMEAVITGIIVGIMMTTLFALGPLLSIRNITPLNTLRISDDQPNQDPIQWLPI